jgi:hypothetical protein
MGNDVLNVKRNADVVFRGIYTTLSGPRTYVENLKNMLECLVLLKSQPNKKILYYVTDNIQRWANESNLVEQVREERKRSRLISMSIHERSGTDVLGRLPTDVARHVASHLGGTQKKKKTVVTQRSIKRRI